MEGLFKSLRECALTLPPVDKVFHKKKQVVGRVKSFSDNLQLCWMF